MQNMVLAATAKTEGLSDEEMWKVVDFIRRLPPKGSLGIPEIYKEEQEEHEHMQGHKPNHS